MPLDLPVPNLRPDAPALRLGYVPLVDAAPLLVADALGMFRAVGLRVALNPEAGWAPLRDKLAFGALDGAHLLAPLVLALGAGLGGVRAELTLGCAISANGNGIFLRHGAPARRLRLGIVHPYSAHHYLLRRWLARAAMADATLVAAPPPAMAGLVRAGELDGFCAGAPWPAAAAAEGLGSVVTGTAALWPGHLEKVLAFRADVAATRAEATLAATAAVLAAGRWLEDAANRAEALRLLGRAAFPALSPAVVASAFDETHRLRFTPGLEAEAGSLWLAEMQAAGHLPPDADATALLAPWARALEARARTRLSLPSEHQA